MSLRFGLATMLCAMLTTPAAIPANDPDFELFGPQYVGVENGETGFGFSLTALKPVTNVRIRAIVDMSEVAKVAGLRSDGGPCSLSESSQLSCEIIENLVPPFPQTFGIGGIWIVRTPEMPAVSKVIRLRVNATVNDTAQVHRDVFLSFSTGNGPADPAAIGADVNTHGRTRQSIKVGIKNVGTNPWLNAAEPPVVGNVDLPSNTQVKSQSDSCQRVSSRRYACQARFLNPGDTAWFEFDLAVDANKPVSNGHITVIPGTRGDHANDAATIRVSPGESLPVTGPRTWMFVVGGAALILLGALFFWLTRRRSALPSVTTPSG